MATHTWRSGRAVSITVELPTALQSYARARSVVELAEPCETVADVLDALSAHCPGVVDRVLTEQGEVREHVNVFVGEESIRYLGGLAAAVADGDTIVIVPAVSGG